jgi:nucleoredoxin
MSKFETYLQSVVSKDGSSATVESLSGKVLGFYFSAHWCGPCRAFTPKLVEKYNEIVAAGQSFEIIFVSADEDEESALNYYSDMPWKMLDYSARDLESELSKEWNITGIPALVLVDERGSIITTEGREALMEVPFDKIKDFEDEKRAAAARELLELSAPFDPVAFFSGHVLDHQQAVVPARELSGKIVGLYFSAHWCPPCRGFTPVLAGKYAELVAAGKPLEIVFVSSDRDEERFDSLHHAHSLIH